MQPKKLIRGGVIFNLKEGEWEEIDDMAELNKLYALKLREELEEIQASDHKDILEFVDLIEVATSFAKVNGFDADQVQAASIKKCIDKGLFNKTVLNNLNPSNPSNKLYFSSCTSVPDHSIIVSSGNFFMSLENKVFARSELYQVSVLDKHMHVGGAELWVECRHSFVVNVEGSSLVKAIRVCKNIDEQPITITFTASGNIHIKYVAL
jgi:predicted house-cleaning noncanonical NTP pyrophosphatase (MazG superfamily)